MPVLYKIDAIDLEEFQLILTCYNDGCPEGIAIAVGFAELEGHYPEGIELDHRVEARIPHDMAARLREKQRQTGSAPPRPSLKDNPHFASAFGAMTHITEGDEKIFQLRPLNRVRRFQIPVESY